MNIISSFNSNVKSSYTAIFSSPTLSGVAFSGSVVTIQVTDAKTGKSRAFTTTASDSSWRQTLSLYQSSLIETWVTDGNGRYNELPTLYLNLASPATSVTQSVQAAKTETKPTLVPQPTVMPRVEATLPPTEKPSEVKSKNCFLFICW